MTLAQAQAKYQAYGDDLAGGKLSSSDRKITKRLRRDLESQFGPRVRQAYPSRAKRRFVTLAKPKKLGKLPFVVVAFDPETGESTGTFPSWAAAFASHIQDLSPAQQRGALATELSRLRDQLIAVDGQLKILKRG